MCQTFFCNCYLNSADQESVCVYISILAIYMYIKRKDGGNEDEDTGKIP